MNRSASIGITKAATKWIRAEYFPIEETSSPPIVPLSKSVLKPYQVGVPTAPKETGTEFITKASITTCIGLKPIPTKIGAAMATGVPNPLAPSSIKAKAQPMIISCATGFSLILPSQLLRVFIAPEVSIIRLKKTAPKITEIGVNTEIIAETTLALSNINSFLK